MPTSIVTGDDSMVCIFLLFFPITAYSVGTFSDYFILGSQTMQEAQALCQKRDQNTYALFQARTLAQVPWYIRWPDRIMRLAESSKAAKLAELWNKLGVIVHDSLHGLVFYKPYSGALWTDPVAQESLQARFGSAAAFQEITKAMENLDEIHERLLDALKKAGSWWPSRARYEGSEQALNELIDIILALYLQIILAINVLEPVQPAAGTQLVFRPVFAYTIMQATKKLHLLKDDVALIGLSRMRRWYHDTVKHRLRDYVERSCGQSMSAVD